MKRTFAIVAVLVVGIVVTLGGGTLRAAPPAAEKPAKTPACRVAVDRGWS